MSFYVFDLDGTLADCTHRLELIRGPRKDWRGFFAACPADRPITAAIEVLRALHGAGHRVEVWSGRSDEVRAETAAWLVRHGVPEQVPLIMRTAGDRRPDDVVKREFLRGAGQPDVIFDDRDRVVAMWRAEGVVCFQVAPGDV